MRSVPRILRIACAAVALPVVVNGCSGGGTEPARVATTVVITPSTASFTAIGQTQQFAAVVKDQNGDTLVNAGVTWSSGNAAVVSISSSGLATAVANGTAQVTATSGTARGDVSVTVAQVVASIAKVSGDAQTGTVAQALAQPLVVQVNDANANAIASITVNFTMVAGAGALGSATATTNASGQAQTTWTLGQIAGTNHQVSAAPTSGTAGTASFTATANAATAAAIVMVSGNGQSGQVATALGNAIVVRVADQFNNPVAGTTVTFAAAAGSGSVSPTSAASVANGQAQTTWTLGQTAGAQTMTASATGLTGSPVPFSAFAAAGPPASVAIQAGDNQTGSAGATLATAPTVIVTDAFNNPKQGATVTFAVASGGGSVTGATQTTNSSGIAAVGSWTLGAAGTNTMTATVTGSGITGNPATFSATATTSTGPAAVAVFVGDNQTGLVGYAVNLRPAVRVSDAGGGPVPGESVTFAVATGGGSVTSATVNTNSNGVAQVGSWLLGASPGTNTLTATVTGAGIAGNPVTFTATGQTSAFTIVVQNVGPAFTPAVQADFDSARARWERMIFQDAPDEPVSLPADACGIFPHPAVNQTVDDILILVQVDSIDGPFNVLARAGFCWYRNPGSLLPAIGVMQFDSADMSRLNTSGQLRDVVLHEMGHSLGIGTLWPASLGVGFPGKGCLQNPSSSGNPVDTYFNCSQGLVMFDSIGGTNYTGGNKVPVENGIGPGSFNSHWRESVFGTEVMTPVVSAAGTPNPMSVLSIASMADLGYGVNLGAADAYSQVFTVRALASVTTVGGVSLIGDIWVGPLYTRGPGGVARRVR